MKKPSEPNVVKPQPKKKKVVSRCEQKKVYASSTFQRKKKVVFNAVVDERNMVKVPKEDLGCALRAGIAIFFHLKSKSKVPEMSHRLFSKEVYNILKKPGVMAVNHVMYLFTTQNLNLADGTISNDPREIFKVIENNHTQQPLMAFGCLLVYGKKNVRDKHAIVLLRAIGSENRPGTYVLIDPKGEHDDIIFSGDDIKTTESKLIAFLEATVPEEDRSHDSFVVAVINDDKDVRNSKFNQHNFRRDLRYVYAGADADAMDVVTSNDQDMFTSNKEFIIKSMSTSVHNMGDVWKVLKKDEAYHYQDVLGSSGDWYSSNGGVEEEKKDADNDNNVPRRVQIKQALLKNLKNTGADFPIVVEDDGIVRISEVETNLKDVEYFISENNELHVCTDIQYKKNLSKPWEPIDKQNKGYYKVTYRKLHEETPMRDVDELYFQVMMRTTRIGAVLRQQEACRSVRNHRELEGVLKNLNVDVGALSRRITMGDEVQFNRALFDNIELSDIVENMLPEVKAFERDNEDQIPDLQPKQYIQNQYYLDTFKIGSPVHPSTVLHFMSSMNNIESNFKPSEDRVYCVDTMILIAQDLDEAVATNFISCVNRKMHYKKIFFLVAIRQHAIIGEIDIAARKVIFNSFFKDDTLEEIHASITNELAAVKSFFDTQVLGRLSVQGFEVDNADIGDKSQKKLNTCALCASLLILQKAGYLTGLSYESIGDLAVTNYGRKIITAVLHFSPRRFGVNDMLYKTTIKTSPLFQNLPAQRINDEDFEYDKVIVLQKYEGLGLKIHLRGVEYTYALTAVVMMDTAEYLHVIRRYNSFHFILRGREHGREYGSFGRGKGKWSNHVYFNSQCQLEGAKFMYEIIEIDSTPIDPARAIGIEHLYGPEYIADSLRPEAASESAIPVTVIRAPRASAIGGYNRTISFNEKNDIVVSIINLFTMVPILRGLAQEDKLKCFINRKDGATGFTVSCFIAACDYIFGTVPRESELLVTFTTALQYQLLDAVSSDSDDSDDSNEPIEVLTLAQEFIRRILKKEFKRECNGTMQNLFLGHEITGDFLLSKEARDDDDDEEYTLAGMVVLNEGICTTYYNHNTAWYEMRSNDQAAIVKLSEELVTSLFSQTNNIQLRLYLKNNVTAVEERIKQILPDDNSIPEYQSAPFNVIRICENCSSQYAELQTGTSGTAAQNYTNNPKSKHHSRRHMNRQAELDQVIQRRMNNFEKINEPIKIEKCDLSNWSPLLQLLLSNVAIQYFFATGRILYAVKKPYTLVSSNIGYLEAKGAKQLGRATCILTQACQDYYDAKNGDVDLDFFNPFLQLQNLTEKYRDGSSMALILEALLHRLSKDTNCAGGDGVINIIDDLFTANCNVKVKCTTDGCQSCGTVRDINKLKTQLIHINVDEDDQTVENLMNRTSAWERAVKWGCRNEDVKCTECSCYCKLVDMKIAGRVPLEVLTFALHRAEDNDPKSLNIEDSLIFHGLDYVLTGVVVEKKSSTSFAYVKHENTWFQCRNETISLVDWENIQVEVSKYASILLYSRIHNESTTDVYKRWKMPNDTPIVPAFRVRSSTKKNEKGVQLQLNNLRRKVELQNKKLERQDEKLNLIIELSRRSSSRSSRHFGDDDTFHEVSFNARTTPRVESNRSLENNHDDLSMRSNDRILPIANEYKDESDDFVPANQASHAANEDQVLPIEEDEIVPTTNNSTPLALDSGLSSNVHVTTDNTAQTSAHAESKQDESHISLSNNIVRPNEADEYKEPHDEFISRITDEINVTEVNQHLLSITANQRRIIQRLDEWQRRTIRLMDQMAILRNRMSLNESRRERHERHIDLLEVRNTQLRMEVQTINEFIGTHYFADSRIKKRKRENEVDDCLFFVSRPLKRRKISTDPPTTLPMRRRRDDDDDDDDDDDNDDGPQHDESDGTTFNNNDHGPQHHESDRTTSNKRARNCSQQSSTSTSTRGTIACTNSACKCNSYDFFLGARSRSTQSTSTRPTRSRSSSRPAVSTNQINNDVVAPTNAYDGNEVWMALKGENCDVENIEAVASSLRLPLDDSDSTGTVMHTWYQEATSLCITNSDYSNISNKSKKMRPVTMQLMLSQLLNERLQRHSDTQKVFQLIANANGITDAAEEVDADHIIMCAEDEDEDGWAIHIKSGQGSLKISSEIVSEFDKEEDDIVTTNQENRSITIKQICSSRNPNHHIKNDMIVVVGTLKILDALLRGEYDNHLSVDQAKNIIQQNFEDDFSPKELGNIRSKFDRHLSVCNPKIRNKKNLAEKFKYNQGYEQRALTSSHRKLKVKRHIQIGIYNVSFLENEHSNWICDTMSIIVTIAEHAVALGVLGELDGKEGFGGFLKKLNYEHFLCDAVVAVYRDLRQFYQIDQLDNDDSKLFSNVLKEQRIGEKLNAAKAEANQKRHREAARRYENIESLIRCIPSASDCRFLFQQSCKTYSVNITNLLTLQMRYDIARYIRSTFTHDRLHIKKIIEDDEESYTDIRVNIANFESELQEAQQRDTLGHTGGLNISVLQKEYDTLINAEKHEKNCRSAQEAAAILAHVTDSPWIDDNGDARTVKLTPYDEAVSAYIKKKYPQHVDVLKYGGKVLRGNQVGVKQKNQIDKMQKLAKERYIINQELKKVREDAKKDYQDKNQSERISDHDLTYKSGQRINMSRPLKMIPCKNGYKTRFVHLTDQSIKIFVRVSINHSVGNKIVDEGELKDLEKLTISKLFNVRKRRSMRHKDPFYDVLVTNGIEARVATLVRDGSSLFGSRREYFATPEIGADAILNTDTSPAAEVNNIGLLGAVSSTASNDPKAKVKKLAKEDARKKKEYIEKNRNEVKSKDFDLVLSCDPGLRSLTFLRSYDKEYPTRLATYLNYHKQRRLAKKLGAPRPPPEPNIFRTIRVGQFDSETGRKNAIKKANARWYKLLNKNYDEENHYSSSFQSSHGNNNATEDDDEDDNEIFEGGVPISYEDAFISLSNYLRQCGDGVALENSKCRKRERMLLGIRQKKLVAKLLKEIAPPDKQVLLNVGHFAASYRGPRQIRMYGKNFVPMKMLIFELSKLPNVFLHYVDEYGTSSFCPECTCKLEQLRINATREQWGAKRCTNKSCRITWSRDISAALLIALVAMHELYPEEQPHLFDGLIEDPENFKRYRTQLKDVEAR
eukprot:CAMPEP_0197324096 /NCGR_PEP_ID=MMETSP0891-20130614/70905_1 /TAXON_ID=44058 ORGANISM="Aureoumbra lagunensis, Strain CCMP1510" /NCGR_SAMPLE_ID=MMETSP0891 /ASSEMBLY_ACC=CAM_ASM_000534 /LENGTH=3143 /DNA_ID=CAMNT_0042816853 /DNA_START=1303 /DNA_END=10734 /DNA_ORIENTATION=-